MKILKMNNFKFLVKKGSGMTTGIIHVDLTIIIKMLRFIVFRQYLALKKKKKVATN